VTQEPDPRRQRRRITDLATHPTGYITVPDFAAYLGFQERTVRKWIDAGVLPAYRFKGLWRIAKTDAIAFVERSRFQV
jgi:excisionase family DNA binding protein